MCQSHMGAKRGLVTSPSSSSNKVKRSKARPNANAAPRAPANENRRSPRIKAVVNTNERLAAWRDGVIMQMRTNARSTRTERRERAHVSPSNTLAFANVGFRASVAMHARVHELSDQNKAAAYGFHNDDARAPYGQKQGLFSGAQLQRLFDRGDLVGSGTNGAVSRTVIGQHRLIVKRFKKATDHWREQQVHLMVYRRLPASRRVYVTMPWMTPAPFSVQTMAAGKAPDRTVSLYTALVQNRLSSLDKKVVAEQLLDFLVAIHHHGIIHNDLGGPNMMVTYNTNDQREPPRLVIIDWGIGWVEDRHDEDYHPMTRADLQRVRWGGPTNPRCDYIWGLTYAEAATLCASHKLWASDVALIRSQLRWDDFVPRYHKIMKPRAV